MLKMISMTLVTGLACLALNGCGGGGGGGNTNVQPRAEPPQTQAPGLPANSEKQQSGGGRSGTTNTTGASNTTGN